MVVLLAAAAALVGDLVTDAAGRAGRGLTLRLVARGQTPERLAATRERFAARGAWRHAADLVRRVDGFPHCPDIVVNSRYDPARDEASPFEVHVGSHGVLGGPQSRGFLLYPTELPDPGESSAPRPCTRCCGGG